MDSAKSYALSKKFVPKNTEKGTQWALSAFLSWRERRNARAFAEESENLVPSSVKWLTFVAEVRKKDGTAFQILRVS